jgi:hypothetical protein
MRGEPLLAAVDRLEPSSERGSIHGRDYDNRFGFLTDKPLQIQLGVAK